MLLSVRERGDTVATFRAIEVRLMETLAAWVPSTPEMEAKLVFGAHIWDVAQHADLLGKRTQELRLPLQFSLKPCDAYTRILDDLASTTISRLRVVGFYDCMLPALDVRFRDYFSRVDTLLDDPTVRILQRIMFDTARMVAEGRALRDALPPADMNEHDWLSDLKRREASIGEIVVYQSVQQRDSSA